MGRDRIVGGAYVSKNRNMVSAQLLENDLTNKDAFCLFGQTVLKERSLFILGVMGLWAGHVCLKIEIWFTRNNSTTSSRRINLVFTQ